MAGSIEKRGKNSYRLTVSELYLKGGEISNGWEYRKKRKK